ncbi:ABC transporter ATP-binding protein [Desulfobacula toluolica]|nr:ABC transporter ATP-binding protein [Desulfobacula toluolica]
MNLAVENISAGYGKTQVISNINLAVGPGRICALMGRNGSGKTTLLRCINGVISPFEGKVSIMGKDICRLSRDRIAGMISVVPQVSFSPFSFSCMDMVLMAGASRIKAWSAPSKKDREKAFSVMAEAGIDHMADSAFNSISGGERQLVMLARGLFQDTPVMLLDEPNSHLDFTNQHRIMALMQTLVKKRKTTVLITLHDPNLVYYYCDEVVLLHNGGVVASGETRTTMTDDVLSRVLGDNIQCDVTLKGVFVVTPKQINSPNNNSGIKVKI